MHTEIRGNTIGHKCHSEESQKETKVQQFMYEVGSKSFRPDKQKPRQMENAVRDI